MASNGASVTAATARVQSAASRIPVPIRKRVGKNAKDTSSTVNGHFTSTQAGPAGDPTTSALAGPHCQRSKVSSAAKGSTDGAVSCAPKQRKKTKMETSLPCGTTTACKTQSVGRRMVTQGGLFRKARGVCRTFDKPACTPSTSAIAAPVRKTAPQWTTTLQRSKEADHKPSAVQADCDQASAATHEVAVAPPPVDGAAPGQSALSRDIAELQEICEKLATTRTRTRQQASRGLMTGMSPVRAGKKGDKGELEELMRLMATTGHRRRAGRAGRTPGKATTGTGFTLGAQSGAALSDLGEVEALMKGYQISCQRRRKDGTRCTVSRVVPLSLKAPISACKFSARKKTRQNYFNFPELHFTPSHHSGPLKDVGNDNLLSPTMDVAYSPFVADMFQRQQKGGEEAARKRQLAPTKDAISLFWESQQQSAEVRKGPKDPISLYNQHMAPQPHTRGPKPTSELESGTVFNQPLLTGTQVSTGHTYTLLQPNGTGLSTNALVGTPLSPALCLSDDTPSAGEGGWHPVGHLVYED